MRKDLKPHQSKAKAAITAHYEREFLELIGEDEKTDVFTDYGDQLIRRARNGLRAELRKQLLAGVVMCEDSYQAGAIEI